jgi:hypothetical protein
MAFAASIVQQLDVLSTRRQQWEATDYKKANEGLYALLGDTLAVYLDKFVNASDEDKVALRKQLIERLTANGVRVVKSSTTLTICSNKWLEGISSLSSLKVRRCPIPE